jgi:hypothetical protein
MNKFIKYILFATIILFTIISTISITIPLLNIILTQKFHIQGQILNPIFTPFTSNYDLSNKINNLTNISLSIFTTQNSTNNANILIYLSLLQFLPILLFPFLLIKTKLYLILILIIVILTIYTTIYFLYIFPELTQLDILYSKGLPHGASLFGLINNNKYFINECKSTCDCINILSKNQYPIYQITKSIIPKQSLNIPLISFPIINIILFIGVIIFDLLPKIYMGINKETLKLIDNKGVIELSSNIIK